MRGLLGLTDGTVRKSISRPHPLAFLSPQTSLLSALRAPLCLSAQVVAQASSCHSLNSELFLVRNLASASYSVIDFDQPEAEPAGEEAVNVEEFFLCHDSERLCSWQTEQFGSVGTD